MGTIPYAPVLDVFLRKPRCGRPPGVKLKNTARVRFEEPILDSKLRGEVNIASDMILLSKRSHDTEFPILAKTTSEADHNFYPWRGPESMGKWTDVVKRYIK